MPKIAYEVKKFTQQTLATIAQAEQIIEQS